MGSLILSLDPYGLHPKVNMFMVDLAGFAPASRILFSITVYAVLTYFQNALCPIESLWLAEQHAQKSHTAPIGSTPGQTIYLSWPFYLGSQKIDHATYQCLLRTLQSYQSY